MMRFTFCFYAVQLSLLSRKLVDGFTIHRNFNSSPRVSKTITSRIGAPPTSRGNVLLFVDLVDAYGGGGDSSGVDQNLSSEEDTDSMSDEEEKIEDFDENMPIDKDDDKRETKRGSSRSYYKNDYENDYDYYRNRDSYDRSSVPPQPSPVPSPSPASPVEFPLPRCTNIEPQQILNWDKEKTLLGPNDEGGRDQAGTGSVVLVTQCTIDRLDNLKQQIQAWDGYASVVIYVSSKFFWNDKRKIKKAFQNDGRVAVSVVHNNYPGASADPYPINYLRNLALLQAREQYQHDRGNMNMGQLSVLLVDVDFVPSLNLQSVLHTKEAHTVLEDEVVIIPAFETLSKKGIYLPSDIDELRDLLASGMADAFHSQSFPQGHTGTNFGKFWELSQAQDADDDDGNPSSSLWNKRYSVQHSEGFEPYIVMAASKVPLYDERFQGYGLNKISHLASVAATVTSFTVLPGVFLIAAAHERSKEWQRIYGDGSSPAVRNELRSNLRALYEDFCKNLENGETAIVSEATSTRLKLLNSD